MDLILIVSRISSVRLLSKNVVSQRRIMRIRRSKSPSIRRHGGNDENRMNVIQMKRQSVVETSTGRDPRRYSFWPCRNIWLLLLFISSLCISHCRWHHRFLFAYFLFISHVSFIRFTVLSSLDLFPNDVKFAGFEVKKLYNFLTNFSIPMILWKNSQICIISSQKG